MFRLNSLLFSPKKFTSQQYKNAKFRLHKQTGNSNQQHLRAREQRIEKFVLERGGGEVTPEGRSRAEAILYGKDQSGRNARSFDNSILMQGRGLGDNTPLRHEEAGKMSMFHRLTGEPLESDKQGGEIPFTPLMSKRMRTGELWPTAPPTGDRVTYTRSLRNDDSSNKSAAKFSAIVEYHLRRSLKAMPQHLAEQLDFSQIMIDRVSGSKRSNKMYIVWSTVDPGYHIQAEPVLIQTNRWVQKLIARRVKNIPNIPQIHWIYNTGSIPEEVSKETRKQMRTAYDDAQDTVEDRVAILRAADTLAYKTRNIDWFMPYLWNKDKKAKEETQMRSDYSKVKQLQKLKMRKLENSAGKL